MFQPQQTYPVFAPYLDGLHIANAGIPEYRFTPTPLFGQFGGGDVGGSTGGNGDAGVVGGRDGPSTAGRFPAAPSNSFHHGASGGPGGMGLGTQGLGPPVAASDSASASVSANAGYSSNSGSGDIHPCLFNIPMPLSEVPRHHLSQHGRQHQQHQQQQYQQHHHQQHRTPQHQNRPPHPHPQQQPQHHHQHHHQHLPQRTHLPSRAAIPYKMGQSLELDPSELAQQEAAARDFEPQLEGPLVGDKVSSQAIAQAYEKADPIYVAKTMALSQTYTHYRPIQGDGNCGWRAIAFAYFETLVRCNDINLVQSQLQRMTELNKYIEEVSGQDPELVGFMLEGSLVLFNDIIVDISEGNDPMINLLAKFNDPEASQCLIYQLRLLAVARLKGHSAQYQSWLDCSVDDFVNKTLLPVNREIDHMCVVLIHDILLSQANIVLDIAYLDRSDGTEVNVHRFPEEANRQDPSTLGPFIYLLYRPDHYDILYRDNQAHALPAPPVPAPLDIQINRVSPFSTNRSAYEGPVHALENSHFMDISPLAMIPGLESSSLSPFGSVATWDSPSFASEVVSAPPPSQLSPPQQQPALHPVRFSKYNFPNLHSIPAESNSSHEPPFTTSTFKNSHFNTAHYNNLNFQPEMYQPDAEEEASSSGHSKSRGRKQSTENCPSIKKEK